jgi:hypothetical protein
MPVDMPRPALMLSLMSQGLTKLPDCLKKYKFALWIFIFEDRIKLCEKGKIRNRGGQTGTRL